MPSFGAGWLDWLCVPSLPYGLAAYCQRDGLSDVPALHFGGALFQPIRQHCCIAQLVAGHAHGSNRQQPNIVGYQGQGTADATGASAGHGA
jgi:hypothetical protein